MEALFSSVVKVLELVKAKDSDGSIIYTWEQAHSDDEMIDFTLGFLPCRLDLNFVRPGIDIAPAPVAGKAPDRFGLLFCANDSPIKAGQRIQCIPDEDGNTVVEGTFEIRVIPDHALDFSSAHHIEVQVFEVNKELDATNWPEDEVLLP